MRRLSTALVAAALSWTLSGICLGDDGQCSIHRPEGRVRREAIKRVPPVYPRLAAGIDRPGVVVADVRFNADGRAFRTTILESPSKPLSDAVERAVAQWRFSYGPNNDGCVVQTKITFYFLPQADDEGHIIDPLAENAGSRYRSALQMTRSERRKGETTWEE
jgi:TonB family protein